MDNTIAIILPNTLAYETTKVVLTELKLDYPLYKSSGNEAVKIAKDLLEKGTKLIISAGITYDYLNNSVSASLLHLPFSGIESAKVIKEALTFSNKIVHIGTESLYHYLQRSSCLLGIDENTVHFHELDLSRSIEEQTYDAISQGYEVVIGGYVAVNYARSKGKIGIEVDVDDMVVKTTILNAQSIAAGIIENESKKELYQAILNSTAEGIVIVDNANRIFAANPKAISIFDDDIVGLDFDDSLRKSNLVDIESANHLEGSSAFNPVVLNKSSVAEHEDQEYNVITINRYSDYQKVHNQAKKSLVQKGFYGEHYFEDIKGHSKAITLAKEKAKVYAKYDSTILITGETGTGKELFAQSIHNASNRKLQPFVSVNCASLPENLIESELFGYVKGAFTGANKEGKMGLFELADGGTIFLDEISEIPITTQSKLLRVIQEGDVIRLGSDVIKVVDTRIICSSNKDLLQLIKEKKFKEDLYYRICVLETKLPPLRDRKEDIEELANAILTKFNQQHKKNITKITPDALKTLENLPLLGNVRELSNIIERMVIFSEDSVIDNDLLMDTIDIAEVTPEDTSVSSGIPSISAAGNLKDLQKEMILSALEQHNGNKAAAARALGIDPSTLWRKLKKFELS